VDIHKPKPWHGFRGFLKEYLIIVVGVLTALGAEQAVEALHERGQAREAQEAIREEMQENVDRIAYHQSLQPCIEARLKEITALLADWANGKAPPAGIVIGDPDDMPLVTQRWQANLNSGRFSRQPVAAQGQQAAFYTRLQKLDDIGMREHYAWSELRILELGPAVLRADARPQLIAALQSARTDASDTLMLARLQLQDAKAAGMTPRPMNSQAIGASPCGPLIAARPGVLPKSS